MSAKAPEKKASLNILGRLRPFVRGHARLLAMSAVTLPFLALAQIVAPYLLRLAIDDHIGPAAAGQAGAIAGLWNLILLLILVLVAELALRFVQLYLMQIAGQRIMHDLRMAVFEHVQRLPMSYFDRNPVGRVMTRVTSDVETLNDLMSQGLVAMVRDIVTLAGIFGVMVWIDWRLTLASFVVFPFLTVILGVLRVRLRRTYDTSRTLVARLNAFLQENIIGMDVVQAFDQAKHSVEQFTGHRSDLLAIDLHGVRLSSLLSATVQAATTVSTALVLAYGGFGVIGGTVTIGILVQFMEYLGRFYRPIEDLSDNYDALQRAAAASHKIFSLLDVPPGIEPLVSPRPLPPFANEIRLENVSFAYSADGPDVLRELNFTLRRGEKVALVGATGSGKSSLVNLLQRLYEQREGTITIDGVDTREFDPHDLRRFFGNVPQDVFLFTDTVGANIGLDPEVVSAEDVATAAGLVEAADFIATLPEGYDSRLGERGANLSFGERQLLAFARAVASQPQVLILDEATSSVDSETEARIQRALQNLIAERTALIIAHRLSTIREVDRIVVLHHGEIREQGTHSELMAQDGVYACLYRLQYDEDRGEAALAP